MSSERHMIVRQRIEISDISADISAIYQISGFIETIFDTENRLKEKSRKIGKCRQYFDEISDSDRNIGAWKTRARGKFFGFFWEIYRRYIENIGDISAIFSIYRRYISQAACVAQICCAENPTVQIYPPFQTTSLTDLMARFESGLIQRPRFHPDLKCDPMVRFLIQRPEIKSKLDPTAVDRSQRLEKDPTVRFSPKLNPTVRIKS